MSTDTTTTPPTPQKPILISGAGLASLLLAQSLLRSNIPFQIYERDASFSFRAQGYRLRLSNEGLNAIESALGPESFAEFWDICGKTGGGGFASVDARTGEVIPIPASSSSSSSSSSSAKQMQKEKKEQQKEAEDNKEAEEEKQVQEQLKNQNLEEEGGEEETPTAAPKNVPDTLSARDGKIIGISRGAMRTFFARGCEPYINWSHHVTGYSLTPTGVIALFSDGTRSPEGSLLVGGEGIYSAIAKQVSLGALKVYDTGARGIHGQAPTTAFQGLGEGVWLITDEANPLGRIFVITNVRQGDMDDASVSFGWTMGAIPGVIKAPNDDLSVVGAAAATIAKELTKDWHEKVQPLFREMEDKETAFWKITCSTPTGVPEWENEERVTVIGDAVHSMTPAGGIGANTAVRDSELLGRLLRERGGWTRGVTREYERLMRVYGSEAVRTSYGMAVKQFGVVIDENSPTV